ncbi:chondroitin sulfate glucuronyltransferase [Plutella xylostella]|uniref:chondroitin sulfate glucuronyltransferase n=1 Tax=Plutella xylostella TaxID=51655 RepID=UPI002032B08E|nr:chondroitin sulfate glucuronyltransferase [Plutella xylostella]
MYSRYLMSQAKHNSYFLVGLALGLWVALVVVPLEEQPACAPPPPADDGFEPVRVERPAAAAAAAAAGRTVQRPRYYSTELGMRAPLLGAVLSAEAALGSRAAALNHTAAALQPALRFFLTASARGGGAGGAGAPSNVVGFTDTREVLKPFHTLKYLADNFLEEYNYFFLSTDAAFINAPRLQQLVSRLSVSQDVYMGVPAEEDSHYCSLESGVLLSRSVLAAVQGALDWCVRNAYSARHHENVGRCVLHAANVPCTTTLQGESYSAVRLSGELSSELSSELAAELAGAVTAGPVAAAPDYYQLHALVSRVHLEHISSESATLARGVRRLRSKQPPPARAAWPPGLRADPALPPPPPTTRFDHPRWTLLNASHAIFSDDHAAAAPHRGHHKKALEMVLEAARAWLQASDTPAEGAPTSAEGPPTGAEGRPTGALRLVEGARLWLPAQGLYYKLLVHTGERLRLLEVVRPLGSARLVPAPYVTESARVAAVLPAGPGAAAWLAKYRVVAERDRNTELIVALIHMRGVPNELESVRAAALALPSHAGVRVIDVDEPISAQHAAAGPISAQDRIERARAAAMKAASTMVTKDTLLLLATEDMEFNEDFLNRVRMNTLPGLQWYSPVGFARYSQYALELRRAGRRPSVNTGRFMTARSDVLAVYRRDLDRAIMLSGDNSTASIPQLLARSLRCLRAPEPALIHAPPPPPCAPPALAAQLAPPAQPAACLRELERRGFSDLNLGAKHSLAKLLLETEAGVV